MRNTFTLASAVALVALPTLLAAQSLRDRIAGVSDGTVRLSYAAREGVCGHGTSVNLRRGDDEWESTCDEGPVRVSLRVRDGRVTSARTRVGGRWRSGTEATDLGMVPAAEAATTLLALAERGDPGGDDLVFPAAIADSATVWPAMLRIAKTERLPRKTRTSAVFWVAQAAGEAATAGLTEIVDDATGDREVREHAVFALSQLPKDAGVPVLLQVARTNPDPSLRRKAIFWLGQSEDPRALRFFEEVLVPRG